MSMTDDIKAQRVHAGGSCIGPYQIERPLGFESLDGLYLARDTLRDQEVAVRIFRISKAEKTVRAPGALDPLSHPNIASIHSVERIEDYLVVTMDYVEGATLQDILREQGKLEPHESLRILSGVASALDHVHNLAPESASSPAHLDIRPANVFVGLDGSVKISDFRLPQFTAPHSPHIGQILSAPVYVAPEQLHGKSSPKSDLWAAGVLFFQMLLGRTPRWPEFMREQTHTLRDLDAEEGPDFASLPEPCRRIMLHCLQPNPAQRYRSARTLLSAVTAAGSTLALKSCPSCGVLLPSGAGAVRGKVLGVISAARLERRGRFASLLEWSRARLLLIGAIVMLLAAAVTFGTFWVRVSNWIEPDAHKAVSDTAGPTPEMRSPAGAVKESAGSKPAGRGTTKPLGAALAPALAGRELETLAGGGAPGGEYGVRLERLKRFVGRYPGTYESAVVTEMVGALERESLDFKAAEDLERKPGATVSQKLAQWKGFLSRQTTGLRRDYALARVHYLTREIENYVGYATLTLRSVTGLPERDSSLLGSGRPDPYLLLLDGNQVLYRTPTAKNSSSPPWYKEIRVYVWSGMRLYLDIWDDNLFGDERLIHQPLSPLPADGLLQVSSGGITIEMEIRRDR